MGLVREEKIYGLVFLAAYKDSKLQNIDTIETFVNQAAVAIQRNDAIEELRNNNLNLTKKVRERTKEVEDLLKQKDDFINQLGHDLKNPLTPLMTLIPIINKKTADHEVKKMLGILDKNVHFMKNLIAKTIELAKLNSPNTAFDIEEVNLFDEITKIIEKNQVILEQNKIIVELDLSKDQFVKADKLRLSELFDNLLTNSIKYSPEDCLINIKSEEIEDFIKISIKDNGMGLTKEQQENIFNEFYKVDESRGDYESSGLGLPICKKIVEKHGGKLWVESKGSGKGSTFHLTLKKRGDDYEG
jgi:signal transduction histidine kinase